MKGTSGRGGGFIDGAKRRDRRGSSDWSGRFRIIPVAAALKRGRQRFNFARTRSIRLNASFKFSREVA
jgi:hypothetical protein